MHQIQRQSPFFRLPAEIRLDILERILVRDTPFSIYDAPFPPPICQVCFQLRQEAFDVCYGRDRFIVSNHIVLADTLDQAGAEKISRMTRLRFTQFGVEDMVGFREEFRLPPRDLPERVSLDVDFLREKPWYRVVTAPSSRDEWILSHPAFVTNASSQGHLLGGQGLEAFRSGWDSHVRMSLIFSMMNEVLKAMWRGSDSATRRLNRDLLERLVGQWIRILHILTCIKEEPRQCDDCKWLLTALASALSRRCQPHQSMRMQDSGLDLDRLLASVEEFEHTERELVRIDAGIDGLNG